MSETLQGSKKQLQVHIVKCWELSNDHRLNKY